jgi:hypothetical protein
MLRRALSLEEVSDGVAIAEIEHQIYGRLVNVADLLQAHSKEYQEQWQIKIPKTDANADKGNIRIRMTIPGVIGDGKAEYVLTTKNSTEQEGGMNEVPIPTTEDNFKQFKLLCEGGMVKDRYFFPIPDTELEWHVDCFYLPGAAIGSGKYHEWVKIDLEVQDITAPLPHLPVKLDNVIINQEGKRTAEEEAQVRSLYDNEFVTKNRLI